MQKTGFPNSKTFSLQKRCALANQNPAIQGYLDTNKYVIWHYSLYLAIEFSIWGNNPRHLSPKECFIGTNATD